MVDSKGYFVFEEFAVERSEKEGGDKSPFKSLIFRSLQKEVMSIVDIILFQIVKNHWIMIIAYLRNIYCLWVFNFSFLFGIWIIFEYLVEIISEWGDTFRFLFWFLDVLWFPRYFAQFYSELFRSKL